MDTNQKRYGIPRTLLLFALATLATFARGEDPNPSQPDAAAEWSKLTADAKETLQNAEDPQAATRAVLEKLERFAADHEAAPEAVYALYNHGLLALETGDQATAKRSLGKAALNRFLEQRELPWTHVYDADQPSGQSVAAQYKVNAIPFMVLIGRDGKIAEMNPRGPALAQAVAEAVAQPNPKPKTAIAP